MRTIFACFLTLVLTLTLSIWLNGNIIDAKLQEKQLGATTALTDTINTFRINVNSTDEALRSTTSTDPGHLHSLNIATGTITLATTTGLNFTNGTGTAFFSTTGIFTNSTITNATTTTLYGTTLTFTGVASTSQLFAGSSTYAGTSTLNSTLLIGPGSSTVQCIQTYLKGTSTLFYITFNTSTLNLTATSTKPTNCN